MQAPSEEMPPPPAAPAAKPPLATPWFLPWFWVFAAVFAAALLGILTRPMALLASFWPANALLLGLMVRDARLARPTGWLAATAGYLCADLLTGGAPVTTLWLTAANLAEVAVGLLLFRGLDARDLALARPQSILRLLMVCLGVSVAAGAMGALLEPLLFGRGAWGGALAWFTAELANYMAVLPMVLTAPAWGGLGTLARRIARRAAQGLGAPALPLWTLAGSLAAMVAVGGPGALAFPLPALLWCAMRYGVFATAVLALLFNALALAAVSVGWLAAITFTTQGLASLRLGLALATLAPLAVASAMARLLQAREEAERQSLAKSQFLAVMSHELRTPVTGIIGFADLMLQDARLKDDLRAQTGLLRSSAQSLLSLVNDVLDFSKMDAGKLQLESIAFSPSALMREVATLMQPSASARGNRLTVQDDGLPPQVIGDPTRLRQVLYNLMGNAIKFTQQGQVALHGHAVQAPDGLRLVFEVRDSGIGMTDAECARLFEPYAQASASTARRFGGTGLGLSICKRLVEAMGGTIGVRSAPGLGSTFAFEVRVQPTGAAASTAGPGAPAAPVLQRGARILLAEDNPVNQLMIATILRRIGHEVTTADNGRLALQAVADGDFDVVLMDLQMPEMDGLTAAQEIRARQGSGRRLPIIGLSADDASRVDPQAAKALDAWLLKPVNWAALDSTIAQLLARPPA